MIAFSWLLLGLFDFAMAGLWVHDGSFGWALFSGVLGVLAFYLAATESE